MNHEKSSLDEAFSGFEAASVTVVKKCELCYNQAYFIPNPSQRRFGEVHEI
ncbi:MAG: hypothetical protein RSA55_03375 [Clostridia bacterium]